MKNTENTTLEGVDVNLETSLKEYGLAWQQSGDEFTFIYGIEINEDCEFIAFDECAMNEKDFGQDFEWIEEKDWKSLFSFIGLNKEEFDALPFPDKIYSLMQSFGTENTFGSNFYFGSSSFDEVAEKYGLDCFERL